MWKQKRNRHKQSQSQTVEDLTQDNIEKVLRFERSIEASSTRMDRVADAITRFCGSMGFLYLHVAWYGLWIGFNVALPRRFDFDPYPFSLLTLVVSLEAIFLSSFILISQNRQSILIDRRAHLDLQINMLAEQENTKMLCLLQKIAEKLMIEQKDPMTAALAQVTQPENLANQIEKSMAARTERPGS